MRICRSGLSGAQFGILNGAVNVRFSQWHGLCNTHGPIQHLWKTVSLLHPLLTRVPLLISERWVKSFGFHWLDVQKPHWQLPCVWSNDLSKGPGQQLALLGEDSSIPEDVMGISGIILTVLVFISFSYLCMVNYCWSALPHSQLTELI